MLLSAIGTLRFPEQIVRLGYRSRNSFTRLPDTRRRILLETPISRSENTAILSQHQSVEDDSEYGASDMASMRDS